MTSASPSIVESRRPFAHPLLETLEQRRLLSASLADGVLTITGTDLADDVEISLQLNDPNTLVVEEGDVQTTFSLADITKIVADGGAGNDRIRIDDKFGAIGVPVEFTGGAGDDTLRGGNGSDVLNGGEGNDEIRGEGGADTLVGGADNDTIRGGASNDDLRGGAGRDSLLGQASDDSLRGGRGDDTLSGGRGDDHVEGGRGRDNVTGGLGADFLAGHSFGSADDSGDNFDDDSSDPLRGDGIPDDGVGTVGTLPDDHGGHGAHDPVGHT